LFLQILFQIQNSSIWKENNLTDLDLLSKHQELLELYNKTGLHLPKPTALNLLNGTDIPNVSHSGPPDLLASGHIC
jgi:hypothetical protein